MWHLSYLTDVGNPLPLIPETSSALRSLSVCLLSVVLGSVYIVDITVTLSYLIFYLLWLYVESKGERLKESLQESLGYIKDSS